MVKDLRTLRLAGLGTRRAALETRSATEFCRQVFVDSPRDNLSVSSCRLPGGLRFLRRRSHEPLFQGILLPQHAGARGRRFQHGVDAPRGSEKQVASDWHEYRSGPNPSLAALMPVECPRNLIQLL